MYFGWLKRLFKRKIKSSNKTSDIATIDTSFIRVPKLSELNEESRKKVLSYFKILNYDNYESILKYSDDLMETSNRERLILSKTLERYYNLHKQNKNPVLSTTKQEKIANSVNFAILANEEFSIIENAILKTRKELELRLIALDMFIKKEEKRKYDFLGVFGKAERLKYLNNKNRLLSERDRLKISIKINNDILITVCNDTKENEIVKLGYEFLKNIQSFNSKEKEYNHEDFESTVRRFLGYRMYDIRTSSYSYDLYKEFDLKVIEFAYKLIGKETPKGKIITKEMIDEVIYNGTEITEDNDWRDLTEIVPRDKIKELYLIVANYSHYLELFKYKHRNDYLLYLDEINKIIDVYEKTATREWDKNEIKSLIQKFSKQLKDYINVCDNYLTENNKKSLNDAYFKIVFLYDLLNKQKYRLLYEEAYFYGLDKLDYYSNYSLILADELLRKVEDKYNIKLKILQYIIKKQEVNSRNDFIKKYYIDYFIYLYDFLQGNTDIFNMIIDFDKNHSIIKKYCAIMNNKNVNFDFNKTIIMEEFFYLMKLLNISYEEYIKIVDEHSTVLIAGRSFYPDFTDFMSKIKIAELENNYDNRILIVPDSIRFEENKEFMIKDLINNQEAIYVPSAYLLGLIIKQNDLGGVKYLIIKENIINSFKEKYFHSWIDSKYEELKIKSIIDRATKPFMLPTREEINASRQSIIDEVVLISQQFDEIFNQLFEKVELCIVPNDIKYKELCIYFDEKMNDNNNSRVKKISMKSIKKILRENSNNN